MTAKPHRLVLQKPLREHSWWVQKWTKSF